MDTSVLQTIKKLLGLDSSVNHFDTDIIMHINSAFMTLAQLGVISPGQFVTNDLTTWASVLGGRTDLQAAQTYVYLKVRLIFDPPATSFVISSYEKEIAVLEWRLNVQAETPTTTV